MEDEGKLSKSQAAFRKTLSQQFITFYILKSIVNKYVIRQKRKLYCCLVDLRKAGDSVWREEMLIKLMQAMWGRRKTLQGY